MNPRTDWAATSTEIVCPMCEYNLRGLSVPRCPECGYTFRWAELVDPTRRLHPYLFEHHPERNIWSFCRTACAGLRPWRFWTTLHPTQPSRMGRLIAYWLIAAVIFSAASFGQLAGAYVQVNRFVQEQRKAVTSQVPPAVLAANPQYMKAIERQFPLAPSRDFFRVLFTVHGEVVVMFTLTAIALVWPWATFLVLGIFQVSMRRARLRPAHVLRCVLYSCDLGLWIGLLAVIPLVVMGCMAESPWWGSGAQYLHFGAAPGRPDREGYYAAANFLYVVHGIVGILFLLGLARLGAGFAKYLRFRRAFLTVLSSQVVLVMLLAVLVMATGLQWPLFDLWRQWLWPVITGTRLR